MTDAWPVVTEPFTQWIVEDRFPAGRPDFAAAGVQMVSDVTPFEHMKLRLLNASHSALAYLGYLAGHETIASTMTDVRFAALARQVMLDAAPTLAMPEGTDIAAYGASLLQRFSNAALHHRTWQIAMDGSQKLPQRLLATMQDRLRLGLSIDTHALAVAGWMRYVTAKDEQDAPSTCAIRLPGNCLILPSAPARSRSALPPRCWKCTIFGALAAIRACAAPSPRLSKLYALGARQTVQTFQPA